MMVEMNFGVVCGCLFGVQPVLAWAFPRVFARAYPPQHGSPSQIRRQPSGYPESFDAYPLSDLTSKARDSEMGETNTFEAMWTPDGTGSNFAVASSSGRKRGMRLAPGVITVDTEFTVQEEITPCNSPASEFGGRMHYFSAVGSEEWTLDEVCRKM